MTQANNDELESLTTRELQERYAQVHGVTTTSRSRGYLMRQIRAGLSQPQDSNEANTPAIEAPPSAPEQPVQAVEIAAERTHTATDATATNETPITPASETITAPIAPQRRTRTQTVASGVRDPRLPAAGTVITREFDGRVHRVTVGEEDFEYEGKRWTSLSALAKHIAGTTWNGLLFFKLIPYVRRAKKAA